MPHFVCTFIQRWLLGLLLWLGKLGIMLLWTWVDKYLFKSVLSFCLYPGVELLDHMAIWGLPENTWTPIFNFFEDTLYCSLQRLYYFTFPLAMHRSSRFSTSLPTLAVFQGFLFSFFPIAILMGAKWYHTMMKEGVCWYLSFFRWGTKSLWTCPRSPGQYMAESGFKPESLLLWFWVLKHDTAWHPGELEGAQETCRM